MNRDRTPAWLLERIALSELPPEELAAAKAKLAAEPGGAERLKAIDEDSALTLERHGPGPVVAEVRRRIRGIPPHHPLAWVRVGAVAFASVAAVLVAVALRPGSVHPEDPEVVREKGLAPYLIVHRQRQAPERLTSGAAVRPGDVLQLSYVSAGAHFGAIVSVDGRGGVTLHLPEAPGPAAALAPGGPHALARAFALDDAPGFERFFLITGEGSFDVQTALDAARRLAASPEAARGTLPLPGFLSQTSFTVEKRSR